MSEDLVELGRAGQLIAEQVYAAGAERPFSEADIFDSLAGTISALVPVFVISSGQPRQLDDGELRNALFRQHGSEMYFSDGRAPVTDLLVTTEGIARVIRILKGSAI